MPITYRRPGVYLEESLLVNSADTASTFTVGVFVGCAGKGPVLEPTRVDSWSDYVNLYGGFNPIQLPSIVDPNDVTATNITPPVPATLAALKSNVTYGDTHYSGPVFTTGQYVKLGDNSTATCTGTGAASVWTAGITGGGILILPSGKVQTYLPYSVYAFFQSGGRSAWIVRAVSTDVNKSGTAAAISVNGKDASEQPLAAFRLSALSVGVWGNTVKYNLATTPNSTVGTAPNADDVFALQILVTNSSGVDEVVETFNGLSVKGDIPGSRRVDMAVNDPSAGSSYVRVDQVNELQGQPVPTTTTAVALIGGVDPGIPDASALSGAAQNQVPKIEGPAMINIVGYHSDIAKVNTSFSAASYVSTTVPSSTWTDRSDLFVINDSAPPRLPNQPSSAYKTSITSTLAVNTGDSYSASYAPWILVPHPTRLGEIVAIPPGGAVMGVAARIDATIGVFRAPAGVIAGVTNAVGVQTKFSDTELGDLNSTNVNIIRSVPGAGICVMGARTRKTYGADRYVSARRTLIFIKEVLRRTTQFAIFENNDQRLWSALTMAADRILRPLWEAGGLKGSNTGEAYYIRCDDTLNTGAVIASGEVRMEIGVALQYPAEFIVIRITQYDRGSFTAEVVPAT